MARLVCILVLVASIACSTQCVEAIPCFPGAEGFGTETVGGRGGRVFTVSNLNDSGPGSLREACEASGPRTVVFGVGGTIRLESALRIAEPFITIAGQSAPGMGICLRDAGIVIETHDVVVRFVRVRIGPSLNMPFDEQDCIRISGESAFNVVIDHCSFSWGIDENASVTSGARDITFSYNIISEALRQPFSETRIGKERSHSMGMILGNHPDRCSIHHNLIAHCNSRNPRIQGGTHDFVNNVIYDWGFLTATFSRDPKVNFIGNYYKPGPASDLVKALVKGDDMGSVYVSGNITPQRPSGDLPEWENLTDADPTAHQAMEPFATAPLTITSAEQAYRDVLRRAGCRLPALDEVDARIIRQTHLGMGIKIDRPASVGGYPRLPIVFGPKDSDGDGMPDDYETVRGLNPRDPSDGNRERSGSGYTNLEDYLNSLVDGWLNEAPRVVTYPVPDAVEQSPYTVTINGKPVPIEQGGRLHPSYYARFQFSGTVRASVTVVDGETEMELLPERYRDNVRTGAGKISFDVFQGGPRILIAKVGGRELPPLFVIADEYDDTAPPARGRMIYNVQDLGVTSEGIRTAEIQKILDDCASNGGGVVYFGPGIYHTGTIRIGDYTTVYLAPGALIVGSTDPADYPVDAGRVETGTHGPECSFSRLIMFDHSRSSELIGYGVIDGMGHVVRNQHGRHVQLVDVTASTNIRIENIVLRNSAEWTLHILGCDKVFVNNLKIINDWAVANTDGIDPDCSSNVFITRYFGYCGDDAVAIKTTGNSDILKPAVNIEIRDSMVMTRKTSLKIGTETYADVRDVLFQDCDIVRSSRGLGLWMRDGSTMSNVTFRDIHMDLMEIPGEGMSGEPIRATIEDRNGGGRIRDVLFDRVYASAPYRSIFAGMPGSRIENVDFWGCEWKITPRTVKMDRKPVLEISNARDFTFKICSLQWLPEQADLWDGFIGQSESENIVNERFVEK